MAKDGTAKGAPDWKKIEAEFRAGALTNVQIAKNYGCTEGAIRKRAKACGWTRDLSEKVRQATRDGLVRSLVRDGEGDRTEPRTDHEIVRQAAARGIEVVRQHRAHLESLQRISSHLARTLESYILGETKAPPVWLGEESVTEAFHRLAVASSKWIPLERKAFSLDDKANDNKEVTQLSDAELKNRIDELLRRRGAAGTAGGAKPSVGARAATS